MNKRYLLFFWELPQLILAFILYCILRTKIISCIKYNDARVYITRGFPGGISLSFVIFLNKNSAAGMKSIKHEYGHTLQSLRLGWLYLIVIGIPSITRVIIWNIFKLESKKYYEGYPENWANRLGGAQ